MERAAWITTPDASALLAPWETGSGRADLRVVVDESRARQTFLGCGASLTESSASLLARLPQEEREAALEQLFSPRTGIGLSVLRQPIGSSAFVAGTRYYTYDDMPSGQTDFELAHFSIQHDEAEILPLLRRARAINGDLRVIGTPWSAPAWMKTSGSLVGGELIDAPRYYEAYARYLTAFVEAYGDAGVPIYALTPQNEPQNRNPDVPGMHLGVEQARKLIQALGRRLRSAGRGHVRVIGYDHNWAMHPDDLAAVPSGEPTERDYPEALLADPETAQWIAGTAFHCYFGGAEAQSALKNRFPFKDVYFTECSGSRGSADSDAKAFSDTLRWHARNVVIGATRNWARTVVTWNLALDPSGGPHANGYTDFSGLVTVEDDGRITPNAEYYALAHLSRFVRPGALCVSSETVETAETVESAEDGSEDVLSVAFRNPGPGGCLVVLVHNQGERERDVEVAATGAGSVVVTLPAGSLVTLELPAAG
ncbi:glycoside hydrolase family 30 protein [Actinospica robiniae]|uniref:glycoside hydrolase family 30 protein n=1 Tax=Actinospica robiniae TaxID=304901 RepID=UPI000429B9D4|nr:glycoside hydrolase family 30 beta sandwich domain-containing protein [Actinospica robiniae]